MRLAPHSAFCLLPFMLAVAACAANGSSGDGFTEDEDAGAAPAPAPDKGDAAATPPTEPSDSGVFVGDVAPPTLIAVIYGHSADTLYKIDPNTKAATVVGDFSGCAQVTDIALDEDSKIYATTKMGLWTIDKVTAKCTQIATGAYPNSLSFVPKGTVDANAEALVGYDSGDYVRIDTVTGQKTTIGKLGGDRISSGDIVSAKGGKTYLTVKGGSGCTANDCLVEVNPSTGAIVFDWKSIGHNDVFGLAFWAGSVYGFDAKGELFEVTFKNNTLKTTALSIPGKPADLVFWGAGSTTSAPITQTN